jgi:hypothetical protein
MTPMAATARQPAIDLDGNVNEGTGPTQNYDADCRTHELENSQIYSRRRCNNGIGAVMYEYYFEKDQSAMWTFSNGHRHDWENVIVFTRGGDEIIRVAPLMPWRLP